MSDPFAEAVAHHNAGRIDAAVESYRRLLARTPTHHRGRLGLALALAGQQKPDEAAAVLHEAMPPPGTPAEADVYFHVGWAFQECRRFAEAASWFERASVARPSFAEAIFNLALAQQNQGLLDQAMDSYRRSLAARPDLPEPRHNLVLLLQILGRHGDAIEVYRQGLTARPNDPDIPRYLVTSTFYDPAADNTSRFAEAERFGAWLRFPPGRPAPVHDNDAEPERRVRVGYLTSDFKDHPIGRNMELLLAARDRDRFEVVVYAELAQPDAMTARLHGLVDAWRSTVGLGDAEVADLIRADRIDILVCLAGHFDRNRPLIAAYRPAPIQISFHDVTTSGGEGTFAYLIADRVVAPRRGTERFTERVLLLPSIYVHAPIEAPPSGPPPCQRNGYITFGSVNNPAKLNGGVLAVWAQVLLAVPRSRLAFKYRNWFHAGELKARIISAFAVFGVGPERLEFLGGDDRLGDHLRCYEAIDIVLDPFPFTGSTATFEALWMGVPVVTLAGPTMMARWSASMLRVLQLDGLVAETADRYVTIARDLAGDIALLARLRAGLRTQIAGSPLCNGPLRARHLERLYRAVWRRWCREPMTPAALAALFEAAQRHHREGRSGEAAVLYRRILAAAPDHADAFHYLGVLDLQAGRGEPAASKIRHALALKPNDAAARTNLGHALNLSERFAEAEAAFRAALAQDPFRGGALIGLGEAMRAQGRNAEAIAAARKAAALAPENPEACMLLGRVLQDSGNAAEALGWLRKAVALRPEDANAHYNLGAALQAAGQTAEAVTAYRQAIAHDPSLGEAHNNLGLLLIDMDDAATAARHLAFAAERLPSRAAVHNNLGKALRHLGRIDEALACFDRAIRLDPAMAEAYVNAGGAQRALMRLEDALPTLRRALELNPDLAEGHANLGLTLRDLGRLDEARSVIEQALARTGAIAELHAAHGIVLNDLGLQEAAREACHRAVALKPDSAVAQRNLLAVLIYGTGVPPAARFREHLRLGALLCRQAAAPGLVSHPDPGRRLRVGYISSDLCQHPVGRNLRPIFEHRDRAAFEVFVYATTSVTDGVTEEFRGRTDTWRSAAGMSDRQLADIVRQDGIDILVHLAGRFDRNQPGVAAHRPAPVQVSFHDPATSGIPGMDYLIADPVLVPRDGSERFVERVLRLPSFYVHGPLRGAPAVGPLPARDAGTLTFGIFNNPAKLSDDSLALWAEVLRRVPGARLLFKFRNRYESEILCRRVRGRLGEAGVGEDRVAIIPADLPQQDSLAIYNQVDLALDPHPFTGSTTTFEALWMGVPVITLATDTMIGRWSASMLRVLGLEELVAATPAAYVEAASRLGADLQRVEQLRGSLRARLEASPLCDGRRRTRQLERLYRALWRRWRGTVGAGFRPRPD